MTVHRVACHVAVIARHADVLVEEDFIEPDDLLLAVAKDNPIRIDAPSLTLHSPAAVWLIKSTAFPATRCRTPTFFLCQYVSCVALDVDGPAHINKARWGRVSVGNL